MPATTFMSFANSMLWFFKKVTMDWIENYQLVSSCQAASCPPCKEVKISNQKQIYNIWQDRYGGFSFRLKQNVERHTGVHSQIEFTLRRATEAELLWFGELRQVYKPENNPQIRLFWVLKVFVLEIFLCFFISQKKPEHNLFFVFVFLLAICNLMFWPMTCIKSMRSIKWLFVSRPLDWTM